ncbi:unnamed protein product [Mycena citricolor]|uniref:POPLD domain-containing protein n=1 Tax=Mycena citricolor TaxID=2018698 RepID=A0AAD2HXW0_9AGAR|nr:unnamed protein product [Mycena citricolor]
MTVSPRIIPSATLAQSELWDEARRNGLRKPRYKKQDIDERRSKNLIPGTPLSALRQDDRVPVLLVQRSTECSGTSDRGLHGWTLFLPAGWGMPFFSSLTFTGTRVAGQRERAAQAFEAGSAYFPRDYPTCLSYTAHVTERESTERARWERTPPAKRPNFEKLGTRSPWRADWEVVLGADPDLVSTQREPGKETWEPWLLRGSGVRALLDKLIADPGVFSAELNALRIKRHFAPLQQSSVLLASSALLRVKINPIKEGNPQDLALIYAIPSDEGELPSEIIGYVTSGNFSLSQGTGFAIGAVSLTSYLKLTTKNLPSERTKSTLTKNPLFVKYRDRDGHVFRAAEIQVLDT